MKTPAAQLKRVFVDNTGSGLIVCDVCGRTKKLSGLTSKLMSKPVPVTCPCGNTFRVIFDARRHYRKPVHLRGIFKVDGSERTYPMIVENISLSGIGIRTPFVDKLKPEEKILVSFNLDDSKKSLIERAAIVKHVNDHYAGLEFVQDRAYDKVLGFYLMQ